MFLDVSVEYQPHRTGLANISVLSPNIARSSVDKDMAKRAGAATASAGLADVYSAPASVGYAKRSA